jgi:hypothetical protein
VTGRFMSPDPLGGSLANPQTLNRYAYVVNNPLRFTDPTGLYHCEGGSGGTQDDCNNGGGMWTTDPGDPGNGQIASGGANTLSFGGSSPASNSEGGGQSSSGGAANQSSSDSFDPNSAAGHLFGAQGLGYWTGANQLVTNAAIGFTAMYGGALGGPAAYSGTTNLAARGFGWYYGLTGGSGVVLGTYEENYLEAAQQIGANALNAPQSVYKFFSNADQWWTLNQSFLQSSIFRGQQFYLNSEPTGTGGFYMEMRYLQSRGIDPFTLPRVLIPH